MHDIFDRLASALCWHRDDVIREIVAYMERTGARVVWPSVVKGRLVFLGRRPHDDDREG